jgi:hypothetical protein
VETSTAVAVEVADKVARVAEKDRAASY